MKPGHRRTSTPFPLSGAKLQMRALAGTMRRVRHRPDGQRGTILSPEIMPDKMPLVASRSGQQLSRRAGGHFINISIYHAVTGSLPCGCPSAHQRANRLGRRPSRSSSQEAPFWRSPNRVVVCQVLLVPGKPKASGAKHQMPSCPSSPGGASPCQRVATGGRPHASGRLPPEVPPSAPAWHPRVNQA
jgi:hypothetical protein